MSTTVERKEKKTTDVVSMHAQKVYMNKLLLLARKMIENDIKL